jgi:hypothetical protein
MSRAFVSEDATAASAAELPERPITRGPNPVTPIRLSWWRLWSRDDGVDAQRA